MEKLSSIISTIDDFVWGPVMLILLVGTGIFLTFRTRFLTWRNLGYALRSTLSKEARTKSRGEGDVSPFSALTTALAATIGIGNMTQGNSISGALNATFHVPTWASGIVITVLAFYMRNR